MRARFDMDLRFLQSVFGKCANCGAGLAMINRKSRLCKDCTQVGNDVEDALRPPPLEGTVLDLATGVALDKLAANIGVTRRVSKAGSLGFGHTVLESDDALRRRIWNECNRRRP